MIILSLLALFLLLESFFSLAIALSIRKTGLIQNYSPKVSVVSYAWNSGNVIERKIRNFLELDYPNYEIIIADNGSTDRTQEICEKYEEEGKIKYYRRETHINKKAPVLDAAIEKYAKGEILAFTDPDGVCEKDWLKKLVQPFQNKKVGAVAGTTHCGNYYENWLTKLRAIEDEWLYDISILGRWHLPDFINIFCGANYALRKSAWEEIGGHGTKSLTEDVETSLKLLGKGYKIDGVNAQVWQEEVRNIKEYINQRTRWQSFSQNFLKYPKGTEELLKHPFGLNLFSITGALPVFSFLSAILMLQPLYFQVFALSFTIFFFSTLIGLIKVGKSFLLPYIPLYLLIEGPLKVMVSLILFKKTIFGEKLKWKSLSSDEKYHKGVELKKT